MTTPEKNTTGKPRAVPNDVKKKQDPEYSPADFELDLEKSTKRLDDPSRMSSLIAALQFSQGQRQFRPCDCEVDDRPCDTAPRGSRLASVTHRRAPTLREPRGQSDEPST